MKTLTSPYPLQRQFAKLILSLLFLIAFGCQEFEADIPSVINEKNDIHYVSTVQGEMIASTIEYPLNQGRKSSPQKTNRSDFSIENLGTKKIKESKSPLGKDNKALYHIFNY